MNLEKPLTDLARAVAGGGGRLYLVGGRARDYWLGDALAAPPEAVPSEAAPAETAPAETDLVIFGLDLAATLRLLAPLGPAYPVSRRTTRDRAREPALIHLRLGPTTLEISPARRLVDGVIIFDPQANLDEDARARDFTINALYGDPLTSSWADPLGGLEDLKNKRLRLCQPGALVADPVRMLRAMALAARFDLVPDPELLAAAARDGYLLAQAPPDRFWPEWRKWSLGAHPHRGLNFLRDSCLLDHWPALAALPGTPQNHHYHPEGDVWVHTTLVVRALARMELPAGCDRQVLILAGLLHDLGKPLVTKNQGGLWLSRGHAQAGAPLAREFLETMRAPQSITRPVVKLVERHMDMVYRDSTTRARRRLARRLAPECSLADYWALATADWNSRGPSLEPFPLTLAEFLEPLAGADRLPPPLLAGRDILAAYPALQPGRIIGRLIRLAETAADEGQIRTKAEALAYIGRFIPET
jgi:tRNA nucleotidyltransferase (CCA-adding enzyme)